jgi:DNA anti-recombination protein RmuC
MEAVAVSASKSSADAERQVRGLGKLQKGIDSLRSAFTASTELALNGLERERLAAIARRESERVRVRELKSKIRAAKLREIDLDAQRHRLQLEKESVARLAQQCEAMRLDCEEAVDDEGSDLRQRILETMAEITRGITADEDRKMAACVEEGVKILARDRSSLREEMEDVVIANRLVTATFRQRTTGPEKRRAKSPAVLSAEVRVGGFRRQRVNAVRDVTAILS